MGSYFGGLFSSVQLGRTPHFSLKLNPKKNGMEYLFVSGQYHDVRLLPGCLGRKSARSEVSDKNVPIDGGSVEDPVHRRLETIVRQTHEVVTYVDDEGVPDG